MEQVKDFLGLPVVQVLLGALISSVVAIVTTRQTLQQQSSALEVEVFSRNLERITEILRQFDPIEFTVVDQEIGQKLSPVQHYENFRKLFFRNASLLPPPIREEVSKKYQRAELAYLYLHAPGDANAPLRQMAKQHAISLGHDVDDLDSMDEGALRAVLTLFGASYRTSLIQVSDMLSGIVFRQFK